MKTRYPLGRKESPPDARDWNLADHIPASAKLGEQEPVNVNWPFPGDTLNQDQTNHCVGFSMADYLINLPINTPCTNKDGHDFYYACKVLDGEPGNEDGSYVRSAAKALKNMGRINAYAFAPNIPTLRWWLINKGPLIMGTAWTEGMFTPDKNNVIHPTGSIVGGHAYIIDELKDGNLYGIQNSWGAYWGQNGKAYISESDLSFIFADGGEALSAVELSATMEKKPASILEIIIRFILSLFSKEK